MGTLLAIFIGGGLGAITRYFVIKAAADLFPSERFPSGLLTVNLTGCLLIGLVAGLLLKLPAQSSSWLPFVVVGFLGSYTTFSSFSLDSVNLLRQGHFFIAFLNLTISLFGGLAATFGGMLIASSISKA